MESDGRWNNDIAARKKEANIRFALQPATWNLPAQYIDEGCFKFLVDKATKTDILALEKTVTEQWTKGGSMKSIVSEEKGDTTTFEKVKTKLTPRTHVFQWDEAAKPIPSSMEDMKACPKRTVQVRLIITGVFHSKEGFFQLSSRVEQLLWKAKEEEGEKRKQEEEPSTPPPPAKKRKKARKSSVTDAPKREQTDNAATWNMDDLMRWVDDYLDRYEKATAIVPQPVDKDDFSNLMEAYDRHQVRKSIEVLTKTLCDEVNHLPSFIKATETRLTMQTRCHHQTYSAQPRHPADWYFMRTENTEIQVSELFLDILKAGVHESRVRHAVGPEQHKAATTYFEDYQRWLTEAKDEGMEEEDEDREVPSETIESEIHTYLANFVRNRCHHILCLPTAINVDLQTLPWHTTLQPFLATVHDIYVRELRYQLLLKMELEPRLLECVQADQHVHVAKSKRYLRDHIIWAIKHLVQTYTAVRKIGLADPRNRADYYLIMKTVEKRAREIFTPEEWITIKGKKGAAKHLDDLLRSNPAAQSEYQAMFANFDQWTYETKRFHAETCSVCGRHTCLACPSEPCTAHV